MPHDPRKKQPKKTIGSEVPEATMTQFNNFIAGNYQKGLAMKGAMAMFQAAPPELRDEAIRGGVAAAKRWFRKQNQIPSPEELAQILREFAKSELPALLAPAREQ